MARGDTHTRRYKDDLPDTTYVEIGERRRPEKGEFLLREDQGNPGRVDQNGITPGRTWSIFGDKRVIVVPIEEFRYTDVEEERLLSAVLGPLPKVSNGDSYEVEGMLR